MAMMAIFACASCGAKIIAGRFRGNEQHAPDYPCVKCLKVTKHIFSSYEFVDERTDAERLREKIRGTGDGPR